MTRGKRASLKPLFTFLAGSFWLVCLAAGCGGGGTDEAALSGDGEAETAAMADEDADIRGAEEGEDLLGEGCLSDETCPQGHACDPILFRCRSIECSDSSRCVELYGPAFECLDNGLCVPSACGRSGDCPKNHYCTGGRCAPIPGCDEIADIFIDPVLPVIRSSEVRPLTAHVIDELGTIIPAAFEIEWTSVNPDVVSVDQNGVARGGFTSDTTTIAARLAFDSEECRIHELSATVSLQNFAPVEKGVRLIVVDHRNGHTIGGATVVLGDQTMITPEEGDKGVVVFENADQPCDMHVFHPEYHYLSLVELETDDILVPLRRFYGVNQVAGIRGRLDYSSIPDIRRKDTRFGVMGMAFVRSLLDLHIGTAFSTSVMTDIFFEGPFHDEIPLPSNVQLVPDDGGTGRELLAVGHEGSSVAWSMGGFLSGADLMELVIERLDDDWGVINAFLLASLSYAGNFYHGILPGIELESHSMVPDDGERLAEPYDREDLNGNGSVDDFIPNYETFTPLGEPLSLTQPLNRRIQVETGRLPIFMGHMLDGVFTLVGTRMGGGQFVPLGVGTKVVNADGLGDKPSVCKGGDVWMNYAPYYGGLYDDYVLLAYALPFSQLFTKNERMLSFSAIVSLNFDPSPGEPDAITMGDFMEFVPYAQVDDVTRRVQVMPIADSDFLRISFTAAGRQWEILVKAQADEGGVVEINLPIPPGDDPFGPELEVTAVELKPDISLDDLAEFNDKPISRLDRYITRYSSYQFDQRKR